MIYHTIVKIRNSRQTYISILSCHKTKYSRNRIILSSDLFVVFVMQKLGQNNPISTVLTNVQEYIMAILQYMRENLQEQDNIEGESQRT